MSYSVPYGNGTLTFDLPSGMSGAFIQSADLSPQRDPATLVKEALQDPLQSPSLVELVADTGVRRVCIAFTDASRACPDHLLIPPLLEQLEEAGLARSATTLLCAVGLHRPITEAEMRVKLSDQVVESYHVSNHNARDTAQLVNLGTCVYDIPLVSAEHSQGNF